MLVGRSLLIALVVGITPTPLVAQEGSKPPAPPDDAAAGRQLAQDLRDHARALEKALVLEGKRDELEFKVYFHANAWHFEVLDRLQLGLAAGKSVTEVRTEIRAIKRRVRSRLEKRAAFELVLRHPRIREEYRPEEEQPVQFFDAATSDSVRLTLDNRPLAWQLLRTENLEPLKTLRVANHKTVKNRALVPFVSAMKPKHPRLVFWGKEARISGLINRSLVEKEKGILRIRLSYEDFFGLYDDRHIIDLNNSANTWKPDIAASADGELPLHPPPLPRRLEEFLASIDEG